MATTRTLRSSVAASENEGPGGLAGKMIVKSRSTAGGLRTGLSTMNQNVMANQRTKVSEGALKPTRNVAKRATVGTQKGLTTRSSNIIKNVSSNDQNVAKVQTKKENNVVAEDVSEPIVGQVDDIDADDKDNPQLVYEYVNEIHAYLMTLEAQQSISSAYLEYPNATIKPKMRNLLVDWLVDVHQQFALLQETLYLTVALVDRYLQSQDGKILKRQELQLLGVTALFVASKYEEMYPPEIGDFVYITDSAYTSEQILSMEIVLLNCLEFNLGRPLPINFLRRYSKAGYVDARTHGLAKYIMELSLVEYTLSHIPPSQLAAASLALAVYLVNGGKVEITSLWTPTLAHYSTYKLQSLTPVINQLASLLIFVHQHELSIARNMAPTSKKLLSAVTKKYASKKFLKVSEMTMLKESSLLLAVSST